MSEKSDKLLESFVNIAQVEEELTTGEALSAAFRFIRGCCLSVAQNQTELVGKTIEINNQAIESIHREMEIAAMAAESGVAVISVTAEEFMDMISGDDDAQRQDEV